MSLSVKKTDLKIRRNGSMVKWKRFFSRGKKWNNWKRWVKSTFMTCCIPRGAVFISKGWICFLSNSSHTTGFGKTRAHSSEEGSHAGREEWAGNEEAQDQSGSVQGGNFDENSYSRRALCSLAQLNVKPRFIFQDIVTVSNKLESVERRIEEKSKEMVISPREDQEKIREELKALQSSREKLRQQKQSLDSRLQDGAILSPQEQRRCVCFVRLPTRIVKYQNTFLNSNNNPVIFFVD